MKKWFIGILILLVVLFAATYIFTPSKSRASGIGHIHSNAAAVQRTLARNDLWNKWSENEFAVRRQLTNGIDIESVKDTSIHGQVLVIPVKNDSCIMTWEKTLPLSINPIMQKFTDFCSKDSNVYGLNIVQTSTKDTFLVSTKSEYNHMPLPEEIYGNIDKLRKYISDSGLVQVAPPMLNISTNDSVQFRCMVAIPVNKITAGKNEIVFVRMVPGRFLTAELKGGPGSIRQGHAIMRQYFSDYNRTSMAIPFEYLVTDRLAEKDTTKWVTKLYYPVY